MNSENANQDRIDMMFGSIDRIDSAEGNVAKFVFTKDDAVAEAVLYRYPDYTTRTVICCSTMSGCPMGCRFCGAGDFFARNLDASEIVAQVTHCINQTGVDPHIMGRLQIMFMSMGEPMLNMRALMIALEMLHHKYPNAALLISTSGPLVSYTSFFEISRRIPMIGLQFSVHETTDEKRNALIPFKSKMSLEQIAAVGGCWHDETGRKPFFNYCAGDENSSVHDAKRLRELFDPAVWNATVSVICERNEGLPARSNHQRDLATNFSSLLVDAGFDVRVFDPAGQDDIGGGCGQLWFVQKWADNNADKTRPTVGYGKPVVHAPNAALAAMENTDE